MIVEFLIVCCLIYALFGDYWAAKAEMLREEAREKQIANDEKEISINGVYNED